jgi:hypothetical protein
MRIGVPGLFGRHHVKRSENARPAAPSAAAAAAGISAP